MLLLLGLKVLPGREGQTAIDHSGKSRRTLYAWKQAYREQGLTGLRPQSKAPRGKRSRHWSRAGMTQIRPLRRAFPNLGKEQVHVLLKPWCQAQQVPCPSESTMGRLIADAPDRMRVSPPVLTPGGKPKRYRRTPVKRRPKGYRPGDVGECVGLDAIERRMGGLRRYLLTYIDEVSGYALAMAVLKLSSQTAKVFFEKCFRLTPFHIQQVVTDGGSEFKGAFDRLLSDSQIVHLLTYPKSPKMNATCERFNRTIQEQFVDFHEDLLFTDLRLFNEKLAEWLFKYNTIRPHKGLDLQTPVQYIINHNQKCSLGWTHTHACAKFKNRVRFDPMSTIHKEIYDAFLEAGTSEQKADAAAQVLSRHPDDMAMKSDIGHIEIELSKLEAKISDLETRMTVRFFTGLALLGAFLGLLIKL